MKKDKNNITLSFKNNITLSFKNIIWFLNNLTSYFTGKRKIITLSFIILMLSSINITFGLSTNSVSALSYESNIGIGFSFNPTLSISFSSSDLVISNLTPGTTSDSNDIVVSVSTNAAYGYTLSVGANSDSLVHSNNSNVFSSIDTDASLSSLTTDNTWGYSISLDNGNNWSNYNGLSSSINTQLVDVNHLSQDTIKFKIAAKASNTQASGEYTNIINFIAVAKPSPQSITDLEYLQDFAYISTTDLNNVKDSIPKNSTFTLKDQRDEQEYTIAKLEDGKIWMTKNLNIAGGTALSADDTDADTSYIESFTTSNNLTKASNAIILPTSNNSRFNTDNYSYIYNSERTDCSRPGCYSYYSWDAATLGSGRNISTNNTDAPYSICPKGWKLPTSRTTSATNWQVESDFYALAHQYGLNSTVSTTENDGDFYTQAGPNTTPNFLLVGFYNGGWLYNIGSNGYYWSSTSYNNGTDARYLLFNSSSINSAYYDSRRSGFAVRCLAG